MDDVIFLRKHVHNKRQIDNEPIVEFLFHDNQYRKTPLIFHANHYLHHGQFDQFHDF